MEMAEMKARMEELLDTIKSMSTNTDQSPQVNLIQNNNVINNNNMVTINCYGHEDTSYIGEDFLTRCVRLMGRGVVDLMEAKHFHKDHEKNWNIKGLRKKDRAVMVMVAPTRWELRDLDRVLSKLYLDNVNKLDDHFCENEELFKDLFKGSFSSVDQWFERVRSKDKTIERSVIRDIFLKLLEKLSDQSPKNHQDIKHKLKDSDSN